MRFAQLLPSLIALFTFMPGAQARIGETFDQCKARYGEPFGEVKEGERVTFRKSGFFVQVAFYQGKADMIGYIKFGGDGEQPALDGSAQPMSENEISIFLNVNSGGRVWRTESSLGIRYTWVTEDGRLGAYYEGKTLVIADKGAIQRLNAVKRREEDRKLNGF